MDILEISDKLNKLNSLKKTWELKKINIIEYKNSQIKYEEKEEETILIPVEIIDENNKNKNDEKNKQFLLIFEEINKIFTGISIIIGENTRIFKCKIKNNNETYYVDKETLEKIKDIISEKEEISKQFLFKKKTKFEPFLKKINIAKEFSKEKLNLDLNQIHKTTGKRIEIFNPFIKKKDLEIAKILKIPLFPITKNNFFIDTTINIFDIKEIKKKIEEKFKILKISTIKKKIPISIKENKRLHPDIREIIEIEINPQLKEEIKERIKLIEKTNINFEKFTNFILTTKKIKIAEKQGNTLFPIWTDKEKIITFQNKEKFREITGIEYKEELEYLKNTYIVNNRGEEIKFNEFYLKNNLNLKSSNLKKINNEEILLKILENKNQKELIIKEDIDKETKELTKNLKKIIENTIIQTISLNSYPRTQAKKTIISKYLQIKIIKTIKTIKNYQKSPKKEETIKKTTKELIKIRKIFQIKKELNQDELFYILQIIYYTLNIMKELEIKKGEEILKLLKEYFKKEQELIIPSLKDSNDKQLGIEKIIEDIIFMNEKKIRNRIQIYLKKDNEFEEVNEVLNLINKIDKIENINEFKIIEKPNKRLIKKIFPKSYKEIISKINKDKNLSEIQIKNRKIKINKLILQYYISKDKKEILDNKIFKAFIKN